MTRFKVHLVDSWRNAIEQYLNTMNSLLVHSITCSQMRSISFLVFFWLRALSLDPRPEQGQPTTHRCFISNVTISEIHP